MKKLTTIFTLGLMLTSTTIAYAKVPVSAQNVIFNGKETEIKGYMIEDSNYFKLRDIAALLKDSEASFNVTFNSSKQRIEITRLSPYQMTKDDLTPLEDSNSDAKPSPQKVYVDGEKVAFPAYSIDGYNYFKLRDLGKVIGFYVDYDKDGNKVIVKGEKLPPKPLLNNQVKVNIISFATDAQSHMKKTSLSSTPKLTTDDFFKQMESIVLLTDKEGQVSGSAEYEKNDNLVILTPLMGKYLGKLAFKPYLSIEQDERREIIPYQDEINVESLLNTYKFKKDKEVLISMGYYVGDEEPQNFRTVSTVSFK